MSKEKSYATVGKSMFLGLLLLIILLNVGRDYFPWKYYTLYLNTPQLSTTIQKGKYIKANDIRMGYIHSFEKQHNSLTTIRLQMKRKFKIPTQTSHYFDEAGHIILKIEDGDSDFLEKGDTLNHIQLVGQPMH